MITDKKNLTIIDADTLIFRSSYNVKSADEALQKCKIAFYSILLETNADYYISFLTSSSHRYEIAQTKDYKGNRKNLEKPKYFRLITEYLKDEFNSQILQNKEADDLCISAYIKFKNDFNCVISSPDKDLRQVEGYYHLPKTKQIEYISEKQAEYNFYTQMLKGDSGDNITGIPGIGEKKAFNILEQAKKNNEDFFTVVLNSYVNYYKIPQIAYSYFSENYLLLYLQRNIEFDYNLTSIELSNIKKELEDLINGKIQKEGEDEFTRGGKREESIKNEGWF